MRPNASEGMARTQPKRAPADAARSKRADQNEVIRRVNEIYKLRVRGKKRSDILQYAAENGWRLSERTIDTYIQRADKLFAVESKEDRDRERGRSKARYEEVIDRAFDNNDLQTVLKAQKQLDELHALKEPELRSVDLTSGGAPISIVFSKVSQPADE